MLRLPSGRLLVVMASAAFTVMLRFAVFETLGLEESVTLTVKLKVPLAVGAPEIAPVLVLRVRPAGKLPELIAQV